MASPPVRRETNINLRASTADKAAIDRAAEVVGQSRSTFMLAASVQRAHQVLADRTRFVLDEATWHAFHAALEEPLAASAQDALQRLLQRTPPWRE